MSGPLCKLCGAAHWPREACSPRAVSQAVERLAGNGSAPRDVKAWVSEARLAPGYGERMPYIPFTPVLPLVVAMPHLADDVEGATKERRAEVWLEAHPDEAEAWKELGSPHDVPTWAASRGETVTESRLVKPQTVTNIPAVTEIPSNKSNAGPGRPKKAGALSRAEVQRRYRERKG